MALFGDFSNTASATTDLDIADLPDLVWYIDTDRSFSGASHADPISPFPDLSPNGYDITAAGGARPQVQKTSNTSPNGLVLARWDGTDDVMSSATPGTWPSVAAGYTFYFYGRLKSSAAFALLFSDDGTITRPQIGYEKAINAVPYVRSEADGTAVKDLHNANIFADLMQMFCVVFKANGTVQAYRALSNGAVTALSANPTYTLNGGENGMSVGASVTGGNGFCTMDLAAGVWCSTEHDATKIGQIRESLRARYGEDS